MGHNNTVAIVSNAEFTTQEIKSMLVLLRDVDKIESFDYYDAEDNIKKTCPSVIILHSNENDKSCLKLLKRIKEDKKTKNIPVVFYPEYATTDYIVEAFDLGINDILTFPLKDYELVIRVIWAIQKSEALLIEKTKNEFLSKLGIVDGETGFYKEEFSLKYLEAVVNQSKGQAQNSCLMLIRVIPAINVEMDKAHLACALKSSVRLNDTVAMKDENTYYVFLSKAKLNGVYSVYERILSKTGALTSISAAAAEVGDEIFEDIINVLDFTIDRTDKNDEIEIVSKQSYLDMYDTQEKDKKALKRLLGEDDEEEKMPVVEEEIEPVVFEEETPENDIFPELDDEEKTVSLGLEIMNEKVRELTEGTNKEKKHSQKRKNKKASEQEQIDERNAIIYKQSYEKKLALVIEPLLKKYAAKLQNKYKTIDVNLNVSLESVFIKSDKNDIMLNFEIGYDKLKTLTFTSGIIALGTEIESDSFNMEVTELDRQKMDVILKTVVEEYENYLTED